MLLFIVKALRGMLPKYIPSLLCLRRNNYLTRSSIEIQLEVPGVCSEHGKPALSYYASWLKLLVRSYWPGLPGRLISMGPSRKNK